MRTDPWALGAAHEAGLDPVERTRRGAWFTPPALARRLVGAALDRWTGPSPPGTVVDPAVGGGAFLLAAHERIPTARLVGHDVDAGAAAVARRALTAVGANTAVAVADGLDPAAAVPADLVVGNPPFLSQLGEATARDAARRAELRRWWGPAAAGYVDDAALFLLAAATMLRPGGVAVLVLPQAVLSTGSAATVRARVAMLGTVEVVWRDDRRDPVFAGTPTCAVALTRSTLPATQDADTDWGHLLAATEGVPRLRVTDGRTLHDIATATADFRDAYYLVADHVAEHRPGHDDPRLAPVGLIDPAHHRWGEVGVRFAKQRWERPVAVGLPADFLAARLGPKVLLATQTRALEALVDPVGNLLPTTPVITLRSRRPWHVAAVLTSPVATVVAARRHAGAARSAGALKLSARQALALPVPGDDHGAWDLAAEAVRLAHDAPDPASRRAHLHRCGTLMLQAHGVDDPDGTTWDWWAERLPDR